MIIENTFSRPKPPLLSVKRQSGAVLAVALIMMLLMTLVGVSGARVSGLDEKMAGNMRDRNLAFQAAESALAAGEVAALSVSIAACPASPANPTGYYQARDADCDGTLESTPIWESIDWDTESVVFDGSLADIGTNPRYIIEYMGTSCVTAGTPCPSGDKRYNYRVTARANGGTTNSLVMLQSVFQVDAS